MESQSTSKQQETPVRVNDVQTGFTYQCGSLDNARQTVVDDLGKWIPQIPFKDFLQHLVPPQPNFNVDATINSLRQDLDCMLPSGRWNGFPNDPKHQKKLEKDVFLPMSNIFNKVVDVIFADMKTTPLVQFVQEPEVSSVPTRKTRPDSCLVLKQESTKDILWSDIMLSFEYKNNNAEQDLIDNVRKCLWSMRHVMQDDPCRRAAFAITIENVSTRAWFCCRSAVIVSDPFDFISQPGLLVQLFAAFAFADKKSLGLDPTVQRNPKDPTNFIFTVHSHHDHSNEKRFRTTEIISSSGAQPLRGRGTRVFAAIEIDEIGNDKNTKIVVLKDTWIDKDRIREGNILAQLSEEANDDDRALVNKYFLTTICHGDVWLSPEVVDDTEKTLMRELAPTDDRFYLMNMRSASTSKSHSGRQRPSQMTRDFGQTYNYSHKTHYRIVFDEKGTTIDKINIYRDVMRTLADTVDALRLLRRLGWVHRDVSIGNVLWYEGGGKLADLEYAKKVDSNTAPHNVRTGTLHFMAIEVAAGKYLFHNSDSAPTRPFIAYLKGDRPAKTKIPWAYNYLHDLESLWWVTVWIFSFNRHDSDGIPTLKQLEDYLGNAQQLFPLSSSDSRSNAFQSTFYEIAENLSPSVQYIVDPLNELRRRLKMQYVAVESKLPVNLGAFNDELYDDFKTLFDGYVTFAQHKTLISLPSEYNELIMKGSKRGGEEHAGGPSSKRRAVI